MIQPEALLADVKRGIGIDYTEARKDAEVLGRISAAIAYFRGAGWEPASLPAPLYVEAVTLYCKMAEDADPARMTMHPVLISYVEQGRRKDGVAEPAD